MAGTSRHQWGPSCCLMFTKVTCSEQVRDPQDFGLARCRNEDLAGGDAQHNARALRAALGMARIAGRTSDCLLLGDRAGAGGGGQARARRATASRPPRRRSTRARPGARLRRSLTFASRRGGGGMSGGDFLESMAQASQERRARGARPSCRKTRCCKQAQATAPPPPTGARHQAGFDLIAELKLRSPAVGQLRAAAEAEDAGRRALSYAEAGSGSAVSVLTEPSRFDGSLAHLSQCREQCAARDAGAGDAQGFPGGSLPGGGGARGGGGRRAHHPADALAAAAG
jgi:hypothetical protein